MTQMVHLGVKKVSGFEFMNPKVYEPKRQSLGIFFEILLHKFRGAPTFSPPNDPFGSYEHPGMVFPLVPFFSI